MYRKAQVKAARDWFLRPVVDRLDAMHLAVGRMESHRVRAQTFADIRDAEFKVFSQFGEDGILQYLLAKVPVTSRTFVEIGVDDYRESNTRFLLQNDNWRGLIIDRGAKHLAFLESSSLRWRYRIDGVSAFVTPADIDGVLADAGFEGEIGLLSIDIDGNDYWLLDAIKAVDPQIVVVEYNSIFGPELAVTVPYDPTFDRFEAHYSGLYFGASLSALCELAAARGYRFVGATSSGVNAFFVRSDLAAALPERTAAEGWVASSVRESRDRRGRLSYVGDASEKLRLVGHLPLYNVVDGSTASVAELLPGS